MLYLDVGRAKGKCRMEMQQCVMTAAHNIGRSPDSWSLSHSSYYSSAISIDHGHLGERVH